MSAWGQVHKHMCCGGGACKTHAGGERPPCATGSREFLILGPWGEGLHSAEQLPPGLLFPPTGRGSGEGMNGTWSTDCVPAHSGVQSCSVCPRESQLVALTSGAGDSRLSLFEPHSVTEE